MSLKIPQTDPFISITETSKSYLTHNFSSKGTVCIWPEDNIWVERSSIVKRKIKER